MRLWVDDIRRAPEGWTQAKTVTEAIRILHNFSSAVEEVSLDHDISHDVMMDNGNVICRPFPCGETFEPVARFISQGYFKNNPTLLKVNIHTANPAGAEKLKNILIEFNPTITLGKPCNRFEGE